MVEAHAWRRRGRSRGHAADATTEPVPGGDVQPAPFFDADADEAGRVHLAWRALRGEVTYVRREASGAWAPRAVTRRGGRVWDASRLFLVGDRVGVAWRGSTTSGPHGGVPMRLFLSRVSLP